MRAITDLEANGLTPTHIHIVVCKEVETGEVRSFTDRDEFVRYAQGVTSWVGHNFLGYDRPALANVWDFHIDYRDVIDTLVLSRMVHSTRPSHSLESWGETLGRPKLHTGITDWSVLTDAMVERCHGDIETNYLLYKSLEKYLTSGRWRKPIETEHFIQHHCRTLHENGFAFNLEGAIALKAEIDAELTVIDAALHSAFVPRLVPVREVQPRLTKHGTIAKNSIPKVLGSDFTPYDHEAPFTLCEWQEFNPGSPTQIVERLNEAGWQPTEKTKGHKEAEKELRTLRRFRRGRRADPERVAVLEEKLKRYAVYGWMICDENLSTLPDTAPAATKLLVRRLLLANRTNTIQKQWIDNYNHDTGRIHGTFHGIGAWTGRMSHSAPNQGNIPKFDAKQPHKTPYSDRMRGLFQAGKDRLLVGVDAESIQLRVFGHYINDPVFITSLVSGDKKDGTDPHSLNQKALGVVCKSRDDAKVFIYAWLLGAGIAKIAAILGCTKDEARAANENFLEFYPGLRLLKERQIPIDAARGYFEGFDGRFVKIWGDDFDERSHFTLAGYLQSGETIVMRRAAQIWYPKLVAEKVLFWWVNFVHDEFQIETLEDLEIAKYVGTVVADAIRQAGEDLNLRCPMAGSVLNSHGQLAVGKSWLETH